MRSLLIFMTVPVVLAACTNVLDPAESPVDVTPSPAAGSTRVAASATPTVLPPSATATVPVRATATAPSVPRATATAPPTATVPVPPTAAAPPTATVVVSPTQAPAPTSPAIPVPGNVIPPIAVVPAFPSLNDGALGRRLLYFAEVPDGSRRAVVVEQAGRVRLLSLASPPSGAELFLDISDRVSTQGNEEGLLGLAFDPDYAHNGRFYVHYSATNPRRSVISRFVADAAAGRADPASEQVVLEVGQPFSNHNGGMIDFGPDGYLYVALGDGGSGGDPQGNGQNLATLLGSILRIDPGRGGARQGYSVPNDNPFVGRPATEALTEIWAYGFRNPFRFSFDRSTGELWAGDVGQNAWEEVNVVTKGGNYGWNVMEGAHCYRSTPCDMSGLIPPVVEYPTREPGCAVTGGYVYRGASIPGLAGVYLYADFCSGIIWGLRRIDGRVVAARQLLDTDLQISSFGQDLAGELYITAFDGRVYRIAGGR